MVFVQIETVAAQGKPEALNPAASSGFLGWGFEPETPQNRNPSLNPVLVNRSQSMRR